MRTDRRIRALALALPVLVTVVLTPALVAAGERPSGRVGAAGQDDRRAEGERLYQQGCASCHGTEGRGVDAPDGSVRGPSLERSGEAAAHYYLSTGRMPLSDSDDQPQRKTPAYSDEEIDALVAYVASLGDGPRLPEVDVEGADLAEGGLIYRGNCQACHGASGSGGALSYGRAAPGLAAADPGEIAAAVRVGPGQMPVFGRGVVDDDELDALVAYVEYLDDPEDPGGLPIGRTGPIPEGFVAWIAGMSALLLLVAWIGTRNPVRRRSEA